MEKVKIIRSGRRTVGLEITGDLQVLVRAPYRMPDREIQKFLKEKEAWIRKHIQKARERQEQRSKEPGLTERERKELTDRAVQAIPERVSYFADIMKVSYGRITIRTQKTRWGSCSSKGNLNFNCLLMLAPPEVLDYVVVHELCHRKEMNHSECFWKEVEKVLPDYRKSKQWLRENGGTLIGKIDS